MNHFKEFLKYASFPIGILIALGGFLLLYQLFDLPSFAEIINFAQSAYDKHGYYVIAIASFLEGLLVINWYFPGSVVILMGTTFAITGQQSVLLTVALVTLCLFVASILNFILGKYGWYKLLLKFGLKNEMDKMKHRLEKHGPKIILVSYFHPHIGSLTATSAGILHIRTRIFMAYSLLAFLLWNSFWTLLVYLVGPQMLKIANFKSLMIIIGAWIIVMGFIFYYKSRKKKVFDEIAPIP
jgi:membrane protein DedA with SNARE-associated domain